MVKQTGEIQGHALMGRHVALILHAATSADW
jgi:hypothetical protein